MIRRLLKRASIHLILRARRTPFWHLDGYMERWWLFGGSYRDKRSAGERGWKGTRLDYAIGKWVCARIHHTLRSDDDRHLHDHPAWSLSIVLSGGYLEVMPRDPRQHPSLDRTQFTLRWCGPGKVVFRRANARHRLIVTPGYEPWSVFVMGAKRNTWGFYTPIGKIPWQYYSSKNNYDAA